MNDIKSDIETNGMEWRAQKWPRNSPGIYGKLIFNKGAENTQPGEEINAVGKTGFSNAEQNRTISSLHMPNSLRMS